METNTEQAVWLKLHKLVDRRVVPVVVRKSAIVTVTEVYDERTQAAAALTLTGGGDGFLLITESFEFIQEQIGTDTA